ncbi:MAG: histidine kinase [Desulfotignum sp.]|nr:histidine kinase [Desulfotignum sp.]MCF8112598.1 histidine kinase [Desulfotignum sp.]MCF8124938.1 histidine kinase [Desulfotignum sp.]
MKNQLPRPFSTLISPLMLAGVILVLTPIFAVMTLDRMEKLKSHITDQQLAKGISLIRTFEAGTRTGMMTMHWGIRRIQDLLQETSLQPDVVYIMIVSGNGTILAHSDPARVGQFLAAVPDIGDSEETARQVFHRYQETDKEKVFEVYKRFTPMESRFYGGPMRMHGMHRMKGWEGLDREKETGFERDVFHKDGALIVVGLSMDQADQAQARLLRHAVGQGILFFVMGCVGVISLMIFAAYRSTKARLTSARALSEKLKKEVETTRHLAAVGKLAAGVAHEIRNPLSSIKGFATYFEKRYIDHPDDVETAQIMVQEVERINRSITQLLEFAKPMAVEKKPVDIQAMISHSLKLVARDLEKKSITAQVDIRSARSRFYTDPDRMNQILLNLYMNSLAAMEEGGTLTVTVTDLLPDNGLEIRVTDDGCGMDEDLLSDIFDPYFTTRPDGTGLGLSIVHRLVENLGGEIQAKSAKNAGTTFFIHLFGPKKDSSHET